MRVPGARPVAIGGTCIGIWLARPPNAVSVGDVSGLVLKPGALTGILCDATSPSTLREGGLIVSRIDVRVRRSSSAGVSRSESDDGKKSSACVDSPSSSNAGMGIGARLPTIPVAAGILAASSGEKKTLFDPG